MSSYNKSKRPKVEGGEGGGGGTTMVDILAEMQEMKGKLSRMDEMQNEINSMKGELLQMDDMKKEISKRDDYINSKMSEMDESVSKCKHLEEKCDKLEKSVKLLAKKDWKYSVPDIPASYWFGKGYDEEDIGSIPDFLGEIKKQTLQLRNGEDCELTGISLGFDDDVLQNDVALLPHWTELANALQMYQSDNTFEISFNNMQLSLPVMNILAPPLKENQLKSLTFHGINTHHDVIEFVVDIMKANHHLTEIRWIDSQIDSEEDARAICLAIVSHPSITRVQLENCFGVEQRLGYDVLCALFASGSGIKSMDLEGNSINTGSCTAIPDYITRNTPLTSLFLANNSLNDEDAVLIAKALKCNNNLRSLRLQRNGISNVGIDAMKKAFYDPTSLNSLSDCNHTCSLQLPGVDNILIYGINHDEGFLPEGTPENISQKPTNRKMKIYYLLSSRNRKGSNVHHLNLELDDEGDDSLSLKLAPKVLNLVQAYCPRNKQVLLPKDTVHPLSIMYEILRSWKMPELFEQQIEPTVS